MSSFTFDSLQRPGIINDTWTWLAVRKSLCNAFGHTPSDDEAIEALACDDVMHLLEKTHNLTRIKWELRRFIRITMQCKGVSYEKAQTQAVPFPTAKWTLDFLYFWRKLNIPAKHLYMTVLANIEEYEATHAKA